MGKDNGQKTPPTPPNTPPQQPPSLTLEQQIGLYVRTLKPAEILEQTMAQVEQSTTLFAAMGYTVVGLLVRKEHAEYVDDKKLAELPDLRYFGPEPERGSVAGLLQQFADVFRKIEEMKEKERGESGIADPRREKKAN